MGSLIAPGRVRHLGHHRQPRHHPHVRRRQTWVLFVACRSPMHWTYTKRRLAFCNLTQDCDDEGTLRLHRLPTDEEATVIRGILGIRKRMEFGPEELERRRASMTKLGARKMSASAAPCVPE